MGKIKNQSKDSIVSGLSPVVGGVLGAAGGMAVPLPAEGEELPRQDGGSQYELSQVSVDGVPGQHSGVESGAVATALSGTVPENESDDQETAGSEEEVQVVGFEPGMNGDSQAGLPTMTPSEESFENMADENFDGAVVDYVVADENPDESGITGLTDGQPAASGIGEPEYGMDLYVSLSHDDYVNDADVGDYMA